LVGQRARRLVPVRGRGGEDAQCLFGRRAGFCGVDDELLIRIGVVGERVPVEDDLADDEVNVRPGASSFDRTWCPAHHAVGRFVAGGIPRAHPASFAGKTTTHPAQIPQEVAASPARTRSSPQPIPR
jgi:hypothetical protein